MHLIRPKPLQKGDTIGFVAPSSPLQPGRLETGIPYLESQGFKIKLGKHLQDADRFLAGRDIDRAQDIMDFFKDPEVKAIMATAGGYGSQRLLPLLDYDLIRHHPKMLVGFSDTTALQLGLLQQAGLVTYSGFTLRDTETGQVDALIERTLLSTLLGKAYHVQEGETVLPGVAEGPLVGGNLSLLTALIGTPYQPTFKNCILLFEDLWLEPYMVDYMLSRLDLAGVFEQVAGIIIGEFEGCIARHLPERDGTIADVIDDWSARFRVPCIKHFPYGHQSRRCMLPIGGWVKLDATGGMVSVS